MSEISNNAMSARDYLISKKEERVREFLSKLPQEVIIDSFHLDCIDFKIDSFDEIMKGIVALKKDIRLLSSQIFSCENPSTKIIRRGSILPPEIYTDYSKKKDALRIILSNKDVLFLYNLYLTEMKQQEEHNSTRKPR